jgi:hypothetical protein
MKLKLTYSEIEADPMVDTTEMILGLASITNFDDEIINLRATTRFSERDCLK